MPASVETVFFGGMGEPLIHPDIVRMVAEASSRGKRTELLSNGTLLSIEMSEALLEAGLDKLWVSIESLNEEDYATIMKGSSLALISANLKNFNLVRFKLRQAKLTLSVAEQSIVPDVGLGLTFVAMRSNIHMLGELARFASKYEAEEVNISNVIPTDEQSLAECLYDRTLAFDLAADFDTSPVSIIKIPVMDFADSAVKTGVMELLSTDTNVMIGEAKVGRNRRYCRFVSEGLCFVRSDGDVSPCMATLHSAKTLLESEPRTIWHHSFGNVKELGLEEIWNRPQYRAFRESVRDFTFSPCIKCGGCDYREENLADCMGNPAPTCGACLWSEGLISCPRGAS
jgi:MoaA/NifB/PqqE/SkfB family radical SAM enzyme